MTFTACYDLNCNPPTYDVVTFLAILELKRLEKGHGDIELHILPGNASGFRKDGLWPESIEERVYLREKLLVPLCELLPSVKLVAVNNDRRTQGWGKEARHISLVKIMEAVRYGSRPLRPRQAYFKKEKLITFTLRQAKHWPLRNSRTEEWHRAAETLRGDGYTVVIVPDTARASPAPYTDPGELASVHLETRAELYASAQLNVGICNGPMWMSIFMDAPTLMLRPTTNAARGCFDDRFYQRCGLTKGDQLPTSPDYQRLVWEEDYETNIVDAIREMLK